MARLYSDLQDGSGRRYYFGLNSAAGGITNAAPASLSLFGRTATVQEQVVAFRTPATAALSLIGYARSSGSTINAGVGALSMVAGTPGKATLMIISNALPPDYSTPVDNNPTIVYIATVTPAPAALQVQSLEHNITQGGNIGFVFPGLASLTLAGYTANLPRYAEVGSLTVNGLPATILKELLIYPDSYQLTIAGGAQVLDAPFHWVDDDPAPSPTWLDG